MANEYWVNPLPAGTGFGQSPYHPASVASRTLKWRYYGGGNLNSAIDPNKAVRSVLRFECLDDYSNVAVSGASAFGKNPDGTSLVLNPGTGNGTLRVSSVISQDGFNTVISSTNTDGSSMPLLRPASAGENNHPGFTFDGNSFLEFLSPLSLSGNYLINLVYNQQAGGAGKRNVIFSNSGTLTDGLVFGSSRVNTAAGTNEPFFRPASGQQERSFSTTVSATLGAQLNQFEFSNASGPAKFYRFDEAAGNDGLLATETFGAAVTTATIGGTLTRLGGTPIEGEGLVGVIYALNITPNGPVPNDALRETAKNFFINKYKINV